jgi:hypothetical protein
VTRLPQEASFSSSPHEHRVPRIVMTTIEWNGADVQLR